MTDRNPMFNTPIDDLTAPSTDDPNDDGVIVREFPLVPVDAFEDDDSDDTPLLPDAMDVDPDAKDELGNIEDPDGD